MISGRIEVRRYGGRDLASHLGRWEHYINGGGRVPLSRHPGWLCVLEQGLRHRPYCLEATVEGETRGLLALSYVRSLLFGRFLVSLPYLNYGGVIADDGLVARALIDSAVEVAEECDVRYLELRHEEAIEHPALTARITSKVHMRLPLPAAAEDLWGQLAAKVRNQVRKGQKSGLAVVWGGPELLAEFYEVFSHNMRDLGTPVYSRRLFENVLRLFPDRAELCVVRAGDRAVAAALLVHGWGITEVLSASSLRKFNSTCANMLMYWHLLVRAVERGQALFDFGRSSDGSPTYRFKKQWGAVPAPSVWQYHVRTGTVTDMRPENPRYERLIRIWQRLPVRLTRWIGPSIIRGIP
jgi:FemAB-related protein (PEP-CTERM system-associated)